MKILTVLQTPVALTWLVGDPTQPIPVGKTQTDMATPVWKYGGESWNRGWATCRDCGTFASTTKPDCDHIEAVKNHLGIKKEQPMTLSNSFGMEFTVDITSDDFVSYEMTRQSGVHNMFDVNRVMTSTGLTKEQVLFIMVHYTALKEKYQVEFCEECESVFTGEEAVDLKRCPHCEPYFGEVNFSTAE